MPRSTVPQAGPAERQIDQHRNAAISGQGQNGSRRLQVVYGVIHADEIQGLPAHDLRQVVVPGRVRRGRADVANAPLCLQFLENPELGGNIREVVYLDQIDGGRADAFEGRFDLRPGGGGVHGTAAPAGLDVELRGPEHLFGDAELVGQCAGYLLRIAIGRCRVEYRAAVVHQRAQDFP
jgi:hypothetical protein